MKVFLIHRSGSRKKAVTLLRQVQRRIGIRLRPVYLRRSRGDVWQKVAAERIADSEAVIVFDPGACHDSENTSWEIHEAKRLGRPVISLDEGGADEASLERLQAIYDHEEEFDSYFSGEGDGLHDLYSMMVESSESLIQRRQRTNTFFITAIGALLAIAGGLARFGTIDSPSVTFVLLSAFGLAGLLLCNSWRNLIDNYGKLNKAKFRVIQKLERSLSAQIYAAEWAALGKGARPTKYQSFTSTENRVPLWFAVLIFGLIMFAVTIRLWS